MTLHHGDCLDVMARFEPESIDAVVTDPPYGLGFMGKAWDHGVPGVAFWAEMLRVAKPGAHLLAFGGTRTVHRIAAAIEDAGWEIRDTLVWAYASGFPKSRNLDGEWQGWGTALKPAWEPIVMARKPLRGTVAGNVLAYGTGALNIDATRIAADYAAEYGETWLRSGKQAKPDDWQGPRDKAEGSTVADRVSPLGRWPANIILTDNIFDGDVPGVVGGGDSPIAGNVAPSTTEHAGQSVFGKYGDSGRPERIDSGTYSRFFLIPKAARSDREPVMASDLPLGDKRWNAGPLQEHGIETGTGRIINRLPRQNQHPTVKPTDLMRHLVRLVTPPGGLVLDPFLGSGTTALAAEMEGFRWVGIEREAEYVAIAEARLNGTQRGLGLAG